MAIEARLFDHCSTRFACALHTSKAMREQHARLGGHHAAAARHRHSSDTGWPPPIISARVRSIVSAWIRAASDPRA